MNAEKLQKMAGAVRVGGKGSVRRKKKAVHKNTSTDDKRLQGTLKRLGVNTIPGIEEVLLINNDGSALQFLNPKVQASIAANTYVVSGPSQQKRAQDVLASMLAGMGGVPNMQSLAQLMGGGGAGLPSFNPEGAADEPEGDDDVPELVGDFEQAAAAKAE
ncbi:EGD1 [Auxenochlorella protothecoides x Auxenochlorella symbiontica]